jgi:hypothetical protein
MTADEPFAKLDAAPDQTIPAQPEPPRETLDGIDAEIAAWTKRLETIAVLKEKARPIEQTGLALDDLHRLRALGMEAAERNERQAKGVLTMRERDEAVPGDCGLRFTRIARAVRQIIVLEQETMGLRPIRPSPGAARHPLPQAGEGKAGGEETGEGQAGEEKAGGGDEAGEEKERERDDLRDRDDTHDYDDYDDCDDYDHGPIEQVLEAVRNVLNVPQPPLRPGPAAPRPATSPHAAEWPRGESPAGGPRHAGGDGPPPPQTPVRERGPP